MDVVDLVKQWGREKGLTDPKAQLNKVLEELGELAHEICRNQYNTPEFRDSIGDTLVTLIILSDMTGNDPIECLKEAYDVIKERTGRTEDGTFIKNA